MSLDANARVRTLVELQTLIAEYWASVDRIEDARSPAAFYTERGEMRLGGLEVRGRERIQEFFRSRAAREIAGERTTRHIAGGLRLQDETECTVVAQAVVLVYSGSGARPLPSQPPSAVGDFTFQCVRDPSHQWLFERVTGTSVFVGAGAPEFAKTT